MLGFHLPKETLVEKYSEMGGCEVLHKILESVAQGTILISEHQEFSRMSLKSALSLVRTNLQLHKCIYRRTIARKNHPLAQHPPQLEMKPCMQNIARQHT